MKILFIVYFLSCGGWLPAQPINKKLYNPGANAERDISDAVKKAKTENKNVFIQAGGNWCSWCLEFNRFCQADMQIDSLIKSDYVVYHLNYSPENENESIFARYGYPQRFGFPVFLIVDGNGNRIHIQNSSYLEQGKSYNKRKLVEFLQQWNRKAVNPAEYKNQ
ncbi:MAG: thioredoxin family protein [Chitinophagaceae bacterium]